MAEISREELIFKLGEKRQNSESNEYIDIGSLFGKNGNIIILPRDMTNLDLSHVFFNYSYCFNFKDVDFSNSSFKHSGLFKINLSEAKFGNNDFTKSSLFNINFGEQDLSSCNFSEAETDNPKIKRLQALAIMRRARFEKIANDKTQNSFLNLLSSDTVKEISMFLYNQQELSSQTIEQAKEEDSYRNKLKAKLNSCACLIM